MIEYKKCIGCGQDIIKAQTSWHLKRKKYCTRKCFLEYESAQKAIRDAALTKQCPQCGETFKKIHTTFNKQVCCSISCGLKYRYGPLAERLKEGYLIDENTGCWNWQKALINGSREPSGYGFISEGERGKARHLLVHRVSYELHVGPIPEGMKIHHKCFNKKCCNPDHLALVTSEENNQQEDVAVLTPKQVRLIKRAFRMKGFMMRKSEVAKKFGVHHQTISSIVKGKSWRNIGSEVPLEYQKAKRLSAAKIKEQDVRIIRRMRWYYRMPIKAIAQQYNLSARTISAITIGRVWKHVV